MTRVTTLTASLAVYASLASAANIRVAAVPRQVQLNTTTAVIPPPMTTTPLASTTSSGTPTTTTELVVSTSVPSPTALLNATLPSQAALAPKCVSVLSRRSQKIF